MPNIPYRCRHLYLSPIRTSYPYITNSNPGLESEFYLNLLAGEIVLANHWLWFQEELASHAVSATRPQRRCYFPASPREFAVRSRRCTVAESGESHSTTRLTWSVELRLTRSVELRRTGASEARESAKDDGERRVRARRSADGHCPDSRTVRRLARCGSVARTAPRSRRESPRDRRPPRLRCRRPDRRWLPGRRRRTRRSC